MTQENLTLDDSIVLEPPTNHSFDSYSFTFLIGAKISINKTFKEATQQPLSRVNGDLSYSLNSRLFTNNT